MGRVDICVLYAGCRYPIELKIRRDDSTYAKGVSQTAGYMDKLGCSEGWLVLFDQSKEKSWEEKLFVKSEHIGDKTITVFGC